MAKGKKIKNLVKGWEQKGELETSEVEWMNLGTEMDEQEESWQCIKCEKTLKTGVECEKCSGWTHFKFAQKKGKKVSKNYNKNHRYLCVDCQEG